MSWVVVLLGSSCVVGPDPSFLGPATDSTSRVSSGSSASASSSGDGSTGSGLDSSGADGAGRVIGGLVAYYLFVDSGDGVIRDRSGAEPPVDLVVADPPRVQWEGPGLTLLESTQVVANGEELRIAQACQQSNEFSLEAWVEPAQSDTDYYANVVTFSRSTGIRNFDIGQAEGLFQTRISTSTNNDNGHPPISIVEAQPGGGSVHLVVTMDVDDVVRLFVDGVLLTQTFLEGDFSKWREASQLGLGNEFRLDSGQDYSWRGTYYLVAIYDRALSEAEVAQNFAAGIPAG